MMQIILGTILLIVYFKILSEPLAEKIRKSKYQLLGWLGALYLAASAVSLILSGLHSYKFL
jgi:hypothetical protein